MGKISLKPEIRDLPTTAGKIRALAVDGMPRADIARALDIRYQHVRNVLERDKLRDIRQTPATATTIASLKVRLGPDGRVVIPAEYRQALGLGEGDLLYARLDGGEIRLLTPRAAMEQVQALVRQYVPADVSLVDELIKERRHEVEREATE